ncbi:hypothetical protein BN1708_019530, partial [Verticillium longisporum]
PTHNQRVFQPSRSLRRQDRASSQHVHPPRRLPLRPRPRSLRRARTRPLDRHPLRPRRQHGD